MFCFEIEKEPHTPISVQVALISLDFGTICLLFAFYGPKLAASLAFESKTFDLALFQKTDLADLFFAIRTNDFRDLLFLRWSNGNWHSFIPPANNYSIIVTAICRYLFLSRGCF